MRIGVFWHVTRSAGVHWGSFEDVWIALGFPQITTLKWSPEYVRGQRALPKTLAPMLIMEFRHVAQHKSELNHFRFRSLVGHGYGVGRGACYAPMEGARKHRHDCLI